jgi:N,N-dimethylformamidase
MGLPFITGYCDKISVQPGDEINFMLSSNNASEVTVQIVKLIHGDENPVGPGFIEREVSTSCSSATEVVEQATQVGSYMVIANSDRFATDASFTMHAYIWPTTPTSGSQGLITRWSDERGAALGINDDGCLELSIGDGKSTTKLRAEAPLQSHVWYFVAASFDAERGVLSLRQEAVINAYNSRVSRIVPRDDTCRQTCTTTLSPATPDADLLLAGYHGKTQVEGLYNGKIDRSGIHGRVLLDVELDSIRDGGSPPHEGLISYWDTTTGYTERGIGDRLVDTGPNAMHGAGYNRPVRAMTGFNWAGRDDCFRLAPEQFGGIYYNADAIIDCKWSPSFSWTIDADLPSGVYAARLRAGTLEDHIVFFVRPKTPTAKIAMLMPTASYLAYANERFILDAPGTEAVTGHTAILHDVDYVLGQHPEWGSSSYDHHADGAGVCYSSYLRPIMGLRPKHRMATTGVPWQFAADMSIVGWLEQLGFSYDVITDEDLHRDGVDCLRPYNVVLNGTHSEYYSEEMMDASEEYLATGGNIMYLGANGYYWVVAFREDEPWCMEIRKLDSGSRAWQAAPGEYYMATTGEKGGIWRNRGRPPQKLTGVGFTSEGMDESMPYRRLPDSYDPAVAWAFEGVDNECFGDFGLGLNGAAGLELDRYDLLWGTPPNTYLLASSEGHSDNYPHVSEEVMFNYPGLGGTQDYQVRADLTYVETTNGGAVFSTGSIAWGQALPCNAGDNDVSRITANVLNRLMIDNE